MVISLIRNQHQHTMEIQQRFLRLTLSQPVQPRLKRASWNILDVVIDAYLLAYIRHRLSCWWTSGCEFEGLEKSFTQKVIALNMVL
jgi:hypothetical protein